MAILKYILTERSSNANIVTFSVCLDHKLSIWFRLTQPLQLQQLYNVEMRQQIIIMLTIIMK